MKEKEEEKNELEEEFLKLYPKKSVKGYHVPKYIDLKPLIQAVKESVFLSSLNNLNIKWLVKNYAKVVAGDYKDFQINTAKNYAEIYTHNYSKEGLGTLFDNGKDIDI